MNFNKGDRVKVKPGSERFEGQTGTVMLDGTQDDRMEIIVVDLDGDPVMRGIYAHELEVITGTGEDEQIEKLATVLVSEGNFPSHVSALDAARSLYRAGVRFRGE